MLKNLTEEKLLIAHRNTHIKMSNELCAFNNTLNRLEQHLKELNKLYEDNISTDLFAYENLVDEIYSDTVFIRASYVNICGVANTLIDEDAEIYHRIDQNFLENLKRESDDVSHVNEQLKQVLKNLG